MDRRTDILKSPYHRIATQQVKEIGKIYNLCFFFIKFSLDRNICNQLFFEREREREKERERFLSSTPRNINHTLKEKYNYS